MNWLFVNPNLVSGTKPETPVTKPVAVKAPTKALKKEKTKKKEEPKPEPKKRGRPSKTELELKREKELEAERIAKEKLVKEQSDKLGYPVFMVGQRVELVDEVLIVKDEPKYGMVTRQDVGDHWTFVSWDDGGGDWRAAKVLKPVVGRLKRKKVKPRTDIEGID